MDEPSTSTSQLQIENIHMLYLGQSLQKKGFLEKAINLVKETVSRLSNATIGSSLRKYVVCNEKLVYNMITIYKTVISEAYEPINNMHIGNHLAIARIMLAIYKKNLLFSLSEEAIDIITCFNHIIAMDSNKEMLMISLLKKTIFLISITFIARLNDLCHIFLKLMTTVQNRFSFNIVEPKEHNISIVHGDKKPRQKILIVEFYNKDQTICPASALTELLEQTKNWRTVEARKDLLFLSSTSPYASASVDAISNWLKNILTFTDLMAKAKDIRAISAYLAQEAGTNINLIVAFDNWSSNEIYHNKLLIFPDGDVTIEVNIEHELESENQEFKDVFYCRNPGENPVVGDVDDHYEVNRQTRTLKWQLPIIDASNKQGSLDFNIVGDDVNVFFPVEVPFISEKLVCDIE
ncbi:7859_t:CDS:2, partial [Cetraspora pellucida]